MLINLLTVDLVIFASLEFANFYFYIGSAIIIIIFAKLFELAHLLSSRNSRVLKPREYYKIYSITFL